MLYESVGVMWIEQCWLEEHPDDGLIEEYFFTDWDDKVIQ